MLIGAIWTLMTMQPDLRPEEKAPAVPIVIAHRGASGYRPEHTLAAYELAIEQGADYIEPDLVITKDGVLVARHENELSSTTDVAKRPEFAARRATKTIDGLPAKGWFAEDFTLAELKTLRVKERIPNLRPKNTQYDGEFPIPTLQEIITLARRKEKELGRPIGIYPETKHPTYFRGIGLPLEEPLVEALHQNGYRGANAPIFIQSFEVGNLKRLREMTDLPLIQLVMTGRPYDYIAQGIKRTYAEMLTPEGLAEIAKYAQGIGPEKALVIPLDTDKRLGTPTSLIAEAHKAGLRVHVWTFRNEDTFLPSDYKGDPEAELLRFLRLGMDGFFSDHPDTAAKARRKR